MSIEDLLKVKTIFKSKEVATLHRISTPFPNTLPLGEEYKRGREKALSEHCQKIIDFAAEHEHWLVINDGIKVVIGDESGAEADRWETTIAVITRTVSQGHAVPVL